MSSQKELLSFLGPAKAGLNAIALFIF